MADVIVSDLVKKYGGWTALHGINLDIKDREFIVFVGPSGSGKSTLLRSIAGLEPIADGKVCIGGEDVTNIDPADRDLSMVFQNYALFPHMSCRANLEFPLKIAGQKMEDINQRVAKAGQLLHIEELLDRKPSELSGGQRQRVAIGRAIVKEPKVFLFDEPLSNLDAELRIKMRVEIVKLHRKLLNTIIYVTHDQVEAMTMADRIVVLRDGRIEQIGTPHELYYRPANQFVASFIGAPQMNILPCRPLSVEKATTRISVGEGFEVTLPIREAPEGELNLGFRPENVSFSKPGFDALELNLKTDLVEHLGALTNVYGRVKIGAQIEMDVTVSGITHVSLKEESTVPIWIPANECHLFDSHGNALIRNVDLPRWE